MVAHMADLDGQAQRKRARQACIACNARRVKCNLTEQRPCHNCVAANCPCETRESRRGKHPRPSKRRRSEDSDVVVGAGDRGRHLDEVAVSHVLASLHKDRTSDGFTQDLPGYESLSPAGHRPGPRQDPRQDDDEGVFLGESSSLRYVNDGPGSATVSAPSLARSVRLRHSYRVPSAARADALIPEWEAERRRVRIDYLKAEGAFSLPVPSVLEGLLKAYFSWFHPCFAIVDEGDIWTQYRQRTLSPLLLQSILFIGVLHCDESVLNPLGFGSRHKAKYTFYSRAKDLYDSETETHKLTIVQALFLMSFWRAGALLEKDTRHWLGCAITLAETKALHRSSGRAESQVAKLRKRIWWSMFTRERQCAAALGLPNRVRDEDCDIEPLERSDYDYAFNSNLPREEAEQYTQYALEMAELAQFLGKIVHTGYLPNQNLSSAHRSQMRNELIKWKQQQTPAIQADNEFGQQSSIHANMQDLAYNNLLILLYRLGFINGAQDNQALDAAIALKAAARNSSIIEEMLSDGNLRHGQIHVITNLFNTLCIHTVQLRRSEGTTRAVAEHRAKLCLLGLQELRKTWEVSNWILQLFFQYLDRSTAARLRMQQEDDSGGNANVGTSHESNSNLSQSLVNDRTAEIRPLDTTPECNAPPESMDVGPVSATPWSWTSEEANQFLFAQIENEFAFGEGGTLDWSPDDNAFGNAFLQQDPMGSTSIP